jgi:YHS domain-containing protein
MKTKSFLVLALGLLVSAPLFAQFPAKVGGKYLQNLDANGCALQGYDCVAMFTMPDSTIKGKSEFASSFEGANYWFATAANKATFDAAPANYAPLYGGFCAIAVSEGNLRPIQVWTHGITDGHLVVNHNAKARKLWLAKPSKHLKQAQEKWPTVSQKDARYDILHGDETQESLSKTSFEGPAK